MTTPARFPRLPRSQERRELELQLRGARLTARERNRLQMELDALEARERG